MNAEYQTYEEKLQELADERARVAELTQIIDE